MALREGSSHCPDLLVKRNRGSSKSLAAVAKVAALETLAAMGTVAAVKAVKQ